MIQNLYALFLGMLLAIFIGVGVATFYAGPAMPKSPDYYSSASLSSKEPTAEQIQADKVYQTQNEQYQKDFSQYSRNVSMIVLGFAVVLLSIGLIFEKKLHVLADGLVLGGVFTLLYAVGQGFAAEEMKYRFAVTSVSLVIALILGYVKFGKYLNESPHR